MQFGVGSMGVYTEEKLVVIPHLIFINTLHVGTWGEQSLSLIYR